MATFIALTLKNYPSGTRIFGPFSIPVGLSKIVLEALRNDWPGNINTDIFDLQIDLSLDDGATWINRFLGFTGIGGNALDELGQTLVSEIAGRNIIEPNNPNRQFKGFLKNYLTLKTQIRATVE